MLRKIHFALVAVVAISSNACIVHTRREPPREVRVEEHREDRHERREDKREEKHEERHEDEHR